MLDPASGELETLIAKGQHDLRICNNAGVAADGTIYFSDSSQRSTSSAGQQTSSSTQEPVGSSSGPPGRVSVLAAGPQFANGVALTEEFAVVAQTGRYQLDRVWLDGGKHEAWITNLPPARTAT